MISRMVLIRQDALGKSDYNRGKALMAYRGYSRNKNNNRSIAKGVPMWNQLRAPHFKRFTRFGMIIRNEEEAGVPRKAIRSIKEKHGHHAILFAGTGKAGQMGMLTAQFDPMIGRRIVESFSRPSATCSYSFNRNLKTRSRA